MAVAPATGRPGGGRAMETAGNPLPLFASRVGEHEPRRGWVWPLTVALHALAAVAVVVVPLLGDEPLPGNEASVVKAFFVAPAFAPAPPPPPPPPAARSAAARVAPKQVPTSFTAPVEVPESLPAATAVDLGLDGGVPGGVEGGVPGGVVGGIVGGIEPAPSPPPQVVRVGGVVHEPRKIRDVAPVYPPFARNARVQGVVILECTLSPQGRVEGVQVLRSVPLLDEAAIKAVRQWLYTPTLVGGVPVGVIMTVTVNFVLRDSSLS